MVGETYTREPSSWTRPLQASIAAFYVVTTLLFGVQVSLSAGTLRNSIRDSVLQAPPRGIPTEQLPSFANTLFAFFMGVAALFALFFLLLAAATYFRRWTWVFIVNAAMLGLITLTNARAVVGLASGGIGLSLVSIVTALAAFGLFVWMIVALTRYGVWGCHRVPATPVA